MSEPERIQDPPRNEDLGGEADYGNDPRPKQRRKVDRQLAERLSVLIEEAMNSRVVPLTEMIRKVG